MCTTAKQNKILIKRLDLHIAQKELKKKDIAATLGIDATTLSKILKENRKPNKSHLEKISYFLIKEQVFTEKEQNITKKVASLQT